VSLGCRSGVARVSLGCRWGVAARVSQVSLRVSLFYRGATPSFPLSPRGFLPEGVAGVAESHFLWLTGEQGKRGRTGGKEG